MVRNSWPWFDSSSEHTSLFLGLRFNEQLSICWRSFLLYHRHRGSIREVQVVATFLPETQIFHDLKFKSRQKKRNVSCWDMHPSELVVHRKSDLSIKASQPPGSKRLQNSGTIWPFGASSHQVDGPFDNPHYLQRARRLLHCLEKEQRASRTKAEKSWDFLGSGRSHAVSLFNSTHGNSVQSPAFIWCPAQSNRSRNCGR